MVQELGKILGVVGGLTVVFYAVGFTAVQSFIHRHGLEGMFWLTSEFYRDAGAKFLLELVRAPLTAWYVFFPLLAALYLALVPKDKALRVHFHRGRGLSLKQAAQVLGLLIVMSAAYVFALSYDRLLGTAGFATFISAVYQVTGDSAAQERQALAFFSLTMPVIVSVAVFLLRFRGALKPEGQGRSAYALTAVAYGIFLSIIPIAYGMHLYDWKTVPLKDPETLGAGSPNVSSTAQVWLLGEFSGRYVFLRKDDTTGQGAIEAVDVKEIKRLNLDLRRSGSLKYQMTGYSPEFLDRSAAIRMKALGIVGGQP